ncbi:MAG: quinone oxidoreductase, partial [Alphaproteobacteria bacterium]|nr:quinone oxidoreductase [Alphaproteobacteria bacterium]
FDPGPPAAGEALIRHEAVGLNFIDVYHRTGTYPFPSLPAVPGMEGAGIVEGVGEGVTDIAAGDRVAYAGLPPGAYAEVRLIPAHRLVKLPDEISTQQGAAMMLQGMTAEYLLRRTFRVQAGQTVLFHAAAGGVGLIACQWLKQLGATVIGTVGSEEKAELARAHGCDHPIVYTKENFVERVKEITDGNGVPVVYDSVGKDTFYKSLDCLQRYGTMVLFGQASGPVEPLDPNILAGKGSLYLTRPTLMNYCIERQDLVNSSKELFEAVGKGLKVEINQTYPLKDTAQAHRDLEARKTTGSTILLP